MFKALLWDVDGTLAETERDGHLVAFNRRIRGARHPLALERTGLGALLHVSGGRERLMHDMQFRRLDPGEDPQNLSTACIG